MTQIEPATFCNHKMGVEELYQTVKEETKEPIAAEVIGEIPEWIEGSMYRDGPGKFEFGDTQYNHWFDGMSLIHRFRISGGKVTYQNRFLESNTFAKNSKADRIIVAGYGTAAYPDPCKNIFRRFFSIFKPNVNTDNGMVNVYPLGDALYSSTETNFINRIDFETLKTLNTVDILKVITVNKATAHPHIDPDGTIHNLGLVIPGKTSYAIIKITPAKPGEQDFCEKAQIVAKIPAQMNMKPSYFHSFGMTENYYIFVEQSMIVNAWTLLRSKFKRIPYNKALEWHPEIPARFHIINRKTGEKVNEEVCYQSEAFFTFHHVNAYEDEGCVVIDLIKIGKEFDAWAAINTAMSLPVIQAERKECDYSFEQSVSKAYRYILPIDFDNTTKGTNLVTLPDSKATAILREGKEKANTKVKLVMDCCGEALCEEIVELPAINYSMVNTKKYRYMYVCGGKVDVFSLCKIDVQTKEVLKWQEDGLYPSEPVFVAAPHATEEDDGVVLSVALNLGQDRCAFLLVLDPKNMEELARAKVNVKIGRDLHATFVPNK